MRTNTEEGKQEKENHQKKIEKDWEKKSRTTTKNDWRRMRKAEGKKLRKINQKEDV